MALAAVPVPHETMIINVSLSRVYYIVNQITQRARTRALARRMWKFTKEAAFYLINVTI